MFCCAHFQSFIGMFCKLISKTLALEKEEEGPSVRLLDRAGRRGKRLLKGGVVAAMALVVLTACSDHAKRVWFSGSIEFTNHYVLLVLFGVGAGVVALIIGVTAVVLMLWVIVAYRRRKGVKGYPRQVAYHMPF